jgi:hypothetical protein
MMDEGASESSRAAKYNVIRADTPKNHLLWAGSKLWINQLGGNLRRRKTTKTARGINENGTALREQKQRRGRSKILQVAALPGG